MLVPVHTSKKLQSPKFKKKYILIHSWRISHNIQHILIIFIYHAFPDFPDPSPPPYSTWFPLFVCFFLKNNPLSRIDAVYVFLGVVSFTGCGWLTRSHTLKDSWVSLSQKSLTIRSSSGVGSEAFCLCAKLLTGLLLCRSWTQLLWVHECHGPIMPRRHCLDSGPPWPRSQNLRDCVASF